MTPHHAVGKRETFTPGPWRIEITHASQGDSDDARIIRGVDGFGVCGWWQWHDNPEVRRANAHLIAAAPALYEALKNCVHALNFCLGMLPTDDPFRTKITKNRDDAVAALSRALPEPTERK